MKWLIGTFLKRQFPTWITEEYFFFCQKKQRTALMSWNCTISLLEFLYKLISKSLSNKVKLDEVAIRRPHPLPHLLWDHEIILAGRDLVLCLDIGKAFDLILHDLMEKVMSNIFVDTNFQGTGCGGPIAGPHTFLFLINIWNLFC